MKILLSLFSILGAGAFCLASEQAVPASPSAENSKDAKSVDFLFPVTATQDSKIVLYQNRGDIAMKDGLYRNAKDYFEKCREVAKGHPEEYGRATVSLGEAMLASGMALEASNLMADYRRQLSQVESGLVPPLNDEWKERMDLCEGEASLRIKDTERSLELLLPLCRKEPISYNRYRAICLVIENWFRKQEWSKAIELLSESRGKFKLEGVPEEEFVLMLAQAKSGSGRFVEAMGMLGAVIANVDRSYSDKAILKASLIRVMCLFKAGKKEEAWNSYLLIAKLCPQYPDAMWFEAVSALAGFFLDKRDYERADELLRLASRLATSEDEYIRAQLMLSDMQMQCQNKTGARETLVALLKACPNNRLYGDISLQLAELMLAEGPANIGGAIALFKQLSEDEKLSSSIRYRSAMQLADCLSNSNKFSEAIEAYMKASQIGNTAQRRASALRLAAEKCVISNRHDEALRLYRMLAEKYSEITDVEDSRLEAALLLKQKNQDAEAIHEILLFLEEHPSSSRYWEARRSAMLWQWSLSDSENDREIYESSLLDMAEKCPDEELSQQMYFDVCQCAMDYQKFMKTISILDRMIERYPHSKGSLTARYMRLILLFQKGMTFDVKADGQPGEEKHSTKKEKEDGSRNLTDRMITCGQEFIELYPQESKTAEVSLMCGDFLAASGSYSKALKFYARALSCANAGVIPLFAQYEYGKCSYFQGDFSAAEASISKIIDVKSGLPAEKTAMEFMVERLAALLKREPTAEEISLSRNIFAQSAMLQGDIYSENAKIQDAISAFSVAGQFSEEGSELQMAALGRKAEMMIVRGDTESINNAYQELTELCKNANNFSLDGQERLRFLKARCLEMMGTGLPEYLRQAQTEYQDLCHDYRNDCRAGLARSWNIYSQAFWRMIEIMVHFGDEESLRQAAAELDEYGAGHLPRAEEATVRSKEIKEKLNK